MKKLRTRSSDPKQRKEEILEAALKLATKHGYKNLTRHAVADAAGCSIALVSHYFNTFAQLERAIMRAAVTQQVLPIVAQGIARQDGQALKAPFELRKAALQSLLIE
jgi:AcrR family transcriptional regulator